MFFFTHPLVMTSSDTTNMTHTSENQLINMAITDQTSTSVMTNPLPSSAEFEMSKQQELFDVISNLCYMQTQVVTMVITATILLDRFDMVISTNDFDNSINRPDPALSISKVCEGDDPPDSSQGCAHGTQVTSLGLTDIGTVTPWRRKGIVFTKLF